MTGAGLLFLTLLLPGGEAPWSPVVSSGVSVVLATMGTPAARSVRMTYDFHGGAGWAGLRRAVALDFPEDWSLTFRARGTGTPNTLEVKFLDASGENVWWARREGFSARMEGETITVRKRHVSFAWGPAGARPLRRAAAVEIVLSAGTGGTGFLEVEEPSLAERAKLAALPEPGVTRTSAGILVDLGGLREFSGLVVDWPAAVPPRFIADAVESR